MLADVKRELSKALVILDKEEGVLQRAIFVVDPQGIVRFSMVTDLSVERTQMRFYGFWTLYKQESYALAIGKR